MSGADHDERSTATRQERLAARLRDNLRRRKQQARALSSAEGTDADEPGGSDPLPKAAPPE